MENGKWKEYAYKLADWTLAHLVNRSDTYGWYPSGQAKTTHKDLTRDKLALHYAGEGSRIGLHSYGQDGQGKWIVIDIDAHVDNFDPDKSNANLELVQRIKSKLTDMGVGCVVDHSNGLGGYKIWIIFDTPVSFTMLRAFGLHLVKDHGLSTEPEVFPKQVSQTPFGSYVRLFGKHHKKQWVSDIDGNGAESPTALLQTPINPIALLPTDLPLCLPDAPSVDCLDDEYEHGDFACDPQDFTRYKGDIGTLDLIGLCREQHKIIGQSGNGFYEVVCPWSGEHTTGKGGAYVHNGSDGKWCSFHCKHGHCSGRGLRDYLLCFESADVDRHCTKTIKVDPILSAQAKLDRLNDAPPPVVAPVKPPRQKSYLIQELHLLPSPRFQVARHITEESLTVMFGESDAYKSFVALDMALSIAYGVPYVGQYKVTQSKVAYVAAEGASGIKKRIFAWCKNRGLPFANDNFMLIPEGFDLTGSNRNEEWQRLGETILERFSGISLLVVDTVARNFGGGDENAPRDMGEFIKSLDSLKRSLHCSILGVHHTGRELNRGARGHSSLRGACDTMISVARSKDGCLIECYKQKDFEPFKRYILKRDIINLADELGFDEEGNPITSCVMHVNNSEKTDWQLMSKDDKEFVAALFAEYDTKRWQAKAAMNQLGIKKSTFYRDLSSVCSQGFVVQDAGFYFVSNKYTSMINS